MKKALLSFLLICIIIPLTTTSCKKDDVLKALRVYFTYRVGYQQSEPVEECMSGDGVCAFELREQNWRPPGTMPEGYGFGYLTLTAKLKLQMVIYLPFLDVNTYREHYKDGIASLPGPWKVAAELTGKLGLADGYTVSMGSYSVGLGHEDGYEVLIVTF